MLINLIWKSKKVKLLSEIKVATTIKVNNYHLTQIKYSTSFQGKVDVLIIKNRNSTKMKKLLLFCSLFFVLTTSYTQENSKQCSTIVLENDNEIPAYIDYIQSGLLYYRKCPDSIGHQYSIPVDIVKFVREPDGVIQSLSEHMVELPYESLSKNKEHSIDQWKFRNKINNKTRSVSSGQSVKIVVNRNNKALKLEGKWIMLTETELILDTEANPSLAIPKKIIKKIVVYKKGKKKRKTKLWIYFLAIPCGIILLLILMTLEDPYWWESFQSFNEFLAALLFIGILIALIFAIVIPIKLIPKTKNIKHPFKGNWEITSPANEMNDVREFYNQP